MGAKIFVRFLDFMHSAAAAAAVWPLPFS